jgi:hypothetical protein
MKCKRHAKRLGGDRIREYECGEKNEDIVRFEKILKDQEK